MFHNDLAAWGRPAGYVVLVKIPSLLATLQWDADGDGYLESLASDPNAPATGPLHLKLVRNGSVYTGSRSSDAVTWHQIDNPVTVPGVAATQGAGMIWTSHAAAISGTATFDSFSVKGS